MGQLRILAYGMFRGVAKRRSDEPRGDDWAWGCIDEKGIEIRSMVESYTAFVVVFVVVDRQLVCLGGNEFTDIFQAGFLIAVIGYGVVFWLQIELGRG